MDEKLLKSKKIGELRELANAAGVPAYYKCKKDELVDRLLALANAGVAAKTAESPEEPAAVPPAEAAAEPVPEKAEPPAPDALQ